MEESQRLEFKQSPPDSWSDSERAELRKDAVAMANGGGGIIIYGLSENEQGRACSICPLADATSLKSRIESILISNIEPPFRKIGIRILDVKGDDVILLKVDAPDSPPNCVCNGEWNRRYPIRQGRDTRPMSHGEIRDALLSDRMLREVSRIAQLVESGNFTNSIDPTSELTSRQLLSISDPELFAQAALEDFCRNAGGRPYLRITGIPDPLGSRVELQDIEAELRTLLSALPGARRQGWFLGHDLEIKRIPVGLSARDQFLESVVVVFWNGAVVFDIPLDTSGATWGYEKYSNEGEKILNPRCFIEPIICMLALIKAISGIRSKIGECQFEIEFLNAESLTVTPCSTSSPAVIFRCGEGNSDHFSSIDCDRVLISGSPFLSNEINKTLARKIVLEVFAELNIVIHVGHIPMEEDRFEILND